jgi:hypothetical protein
MKKKTILLIFIILFFTGCTPNYNIVIDDSLITEELIIPENDDHYAERFSNLYSIVDKKKQYDFSVSENSAVFKYVYSFDEFNESNIIKSCYESFHLIKENDYYVLQTGLNFNCYPLQISDYEFVEFDELKINIKIVNYEVLENNADYINKNVYSWVINKNNYTNKPIIIKIKEKEDKKTNNIYLVVGSIILLICLIGLIIYIFINSLKNKNNKI